MKRIFLAILVAAAVISPGVPAFSADAAGGQAPATKVTAYYFHGSFRCPTCRKLERYSKEAIENNFKDALASGRLEFRTVNVEDRGNEHFVNDYQLYTKALVLSSVKDGKEVRSKNLTKIWELAGNQQGFSEYVRVEVADFLKGS